jgi:hypothetical protein
MSLAFRASHLDPDNNSFVTHPVIVLSDNHAVNAGLQVKQDIRLSDYLSNTRPIIQVKFEGDVAGTLNLNKVEAIVDRLPVHSDRRMIIEKGTVSIRVRFGSGLLVWGRLHVFDPDHWLNEFDFTNRNQGIFAVLTQSGARWDGDEVQGVTVLVNFDRALGVELLDQ